MIKEDVDTMELRTRFAPSPTGYLHIGGLRTALYGYLFAKQGNGKFILRIEDTDQERYVEGATELIYRTLRDTGLVYDEGPDVGGDYGPYIQSQRKAIYKRVAEELVEKGGAYYCFCTKERLEELRAECETHGDTFKYDKHCLNLDKAEVQRRIAAGEPYVIRQNVPLEGQTSFDDLVFGTITVDNNTLDDTVLLKSDGMPTYNFANVVDDYLMRITHVIRGTEYLSSTPKYNLLYQSLGYPIPKYLHLPPVMKDHSKKLSKRDGDASYEDFIKKGYLKDALINYIALLGWSPGDDREKFTLKELEQVFSVSGINKAPAIFDVAKLTWLNAEYIRALTPEAYTEYALPYYKQVLGSNITDEQLSILAAILQPRTEIFSQLPGLIDFLVNQPEYDAELFVNKKSKTDRAISRAVLEDVIPMLEALPDWTQPALHDLLMGYALKREMKNGTVLWPVRIAMSGQAVTPGGAIEIAGLLGRDESLRRLKAGLEKLK